MRWTLITGAAKGVGRAIALDLAAHGYPVVVHFCTSREEALEVVAECRALGSAAEAIQGSFSTRQETAAFIERYLEKFPETQNLINNVGNFFVGTSMETPEEIWHDLFQTNVHAPFALIQRLAPSLKANSGSIVNIGFAGISYQYTSVHCAAYDVTKAALWRMTRELALEFAADRVRVNMVSPGHLENTVNSLRAELPLKRLGTLTEVARVVRFFLEESSEYVTGQNIEVSGGVRL